MYANLYLYNCDSSGQNAFDGYATHTLLQGFGVREQAAAADRIRHPRGRVYDALIKAPAREARSTDLDRLLEPI